SAVSRTICGCLGHGGGAQHLKPDSIVSLNLHRAASRRIIEGKKCPHREESLSPLVLWDCSPLPFPLPHSNPPTPRASPRPLALRPPSEHPSQSAPQSHQPPSPKPKSSSRSK